MNLSESDNLTGCWLDRKWEWSKRQFDLTLTADLQVTSFSNLPRVKILAQLRWWITSEVTNYEFRKWLQTWVELTTVVDKNGCEGGEGTGSMGSQGDRRVTFEKLAPTSLPPPPPLPPKYTKLSSEPSLSSLSSTYHCEICHLDNQHCLLHDDSWKFSSQRSHLHDLDDKFLNLPRHQIKLQQQHV